jgi:hypothetical protein
MRLLKSVLITTLLLGVLYLPVAAGDDANPGDIVINEIMQNPAAVSDTLGEWIEIYNTTGATININGWTLKDDGADSHVINNGGPLNVASGSYVVLCRNGNSSTNGGVTCDYTYSGFLLANGDDEVVLQEDAGAQQEIARVVYDGGPTFPDPTGASMVYVPSAQPPVVGYFADNQLATQWGTSTSSFGGGDLGTPGSRNDQGGVITAVKFNSFVGDSFSGLAAVFLLTGGLVALRKRK